MEKGRESVSRVKIIVLFAMIFLLGALAGSVATKWYVQKELTSMVRGDLGARKARIVRRLSRRLHLTPEQRREVERIVGESQRELMALRDQHLQEVRRIFDETEKRIKAQLTPEQQVELERMYSRMKARWEARAKRRRTNPRLRRDHPKAGSPPWGGRGGFGHGEGPGR